MKIRNLLKKKVMKNQIQQPKHHLVKRKKKTIGDANCHNCGALLQGNFCHNCGQSIEETNKPFKEFLFDILGSLYAFDLRFWNSIKLMFTHPAKLSEAYLQGKRMSFTPPFRMYFFVSFIFFYTMNMKTDEAFESGDDGKKSSFISINEIDSTTVNDHVLSSINQADLSPIDSIKSAIISKQEFEDSVALNVILDTITQQILNPIDSIFTGISEGQGIINNWDTTNVSLGVLDFSDKKINEIFKNKESQKLFLAKAYKNLSWVMFLLMPIYALLLQLLYLRRRKYYISHLIFSINTHTQIFLILTVFFFFFFEPRGFLLLLIPFFMLRGMKYFYKQSWRKTIVKFFILTTLYNFVLLAALVVIFIITLGLS